MNAWLRKKETKVTFWRLVLSFSLAVLMSVLFVYEGVRQLRLTFWGVKTEATVVDIKRAGRGVTVIGEFRDSTGMLRKANIHYANGTGLNLEARISVLYLPSDHNCVVIANFRRFVVTGCGVVLALLMWVAFIVSWTKYRSTE